MKNNTILIDILLGIIFLLSLIAFIFLTRYCYIINVVEPTSPFMYGGSATEEEVKELFYNSSHVVIIGSVFTGITTFLSCVALFLINLNFIKKIFKKADPAADPNNHI